VGGAGWWLGGEGADVLCDRVGWRDGCEAMEARGEYGIMCGILPANERVHIIVGCIFSSYYTVGVVSLNSER
jgi:hypothetical protein